MIFYIILLLIILAIIIWGGVTRWKFISKNKDYYEKSKNKPSLYVKISHGLGNCLRPLLSVISIAKKLPNYQIKLVNLKLVWCWTGGTGIDNIFNLKGISRVSDDKLDNISCHMFMKTDFLANNTEKKLVRPYLKNMKKNSKSYSLMNQEKIDEVLKKGEDIYLDSYTYIPSKFVDSSLYPKIFNDILLPDIKQKALEIKKKLGLNKNTIACHIRAGDWNMDETEKVKKIKEKIKNQPQQQFFVCSDEKKYEDLLSNLPNVKIFSKKSYINDTSNLSKEVIRSNPNLECPKFAKYNTWYLDRQGIDDSIIDLCCLSYCNSQNEEYHTHGSTFRNLSQKISGWED